MKTVLQCYTLKPPLFPPSDIHLAAAILDILRPHQTIDVASRRRTIRAVGHSRVGPPNDDHRLGRTTKLMHIHA